MFGKECVPIPQKIYDITKRLKTSDKVEQYFLGFLAFLDSTEQYSRRYQDQYMIEDARHTISGKNKRHTIVKNQIMVNTRDYIIHKANHKKGMLCKVKNLIVF